MRTAAGLASAVVLAEPFAFASLSGVHESPGIRPLYQRVLPMLSDVKLFASVGDVRSAEEFLSSRRALYAHDRQRYPFYFGHESRARSLFAPSIVKAVSTTKAIEDTLISSILAHSYESEHATQKEDAAELASELLRIRENRAITFALFRRATRKEPDLTGYFIRRGISMAYTQHHMKLFADSTIVPGFPQLGQLDELLVQPLHWLPQFSWMNELFRWAGQEFHSALLTLDKHAWEEFVAFALSSDAREFRLRLISWKRAEIVRGHAAMVREFRALAAIRTNVTRCERWQDNLTLAAKSVWPRFLTEDVMSSTVLIQCVNANERRGIVRACSDAGMSRGQMPIGAHVAAESLGAYGGLHFLLIRSGAGSGGQDGAQGVVMDAIDDFQPRMVAAVGVAFGLKVKVRTADPVVILASVVKNYERVRLGVHIDGTAELRDRGQADTPDPIRLQKLRTVADSIGMNATIGPLLSGEKLVDDPTFRTLLQDRFPDALGGEMEASGVAAACARRHVPWLVVKAVSDLGDGTKSTMHINEDSVQEAAAYAAMSLVLAGAKNGCL